MMAVNERQTFEKNGNFLMRENSVGEIILFKKMPTIRIA
jgi:hypothetical protein